MNDIAVALLPHPGADAPEWGQFHIGIIAIQSDRLPPFQDIALPLRQRRVAPRLTPTIEEATMSTLQNKVAVITGGTSGIGLVAPQRFVAEGAFVYVFARRQDELDKTVASIGRNIVGVQGDVSNLADLDRLYAKVASERGEKGRIDILGRLGRPEEIASTALFLV